MRLSAVTPLAFGALLLGCDATGQSTPDNINAIVDRTLTNDTGTLVIRANGTGSGTFNGGSLMIAWDEENGQFCRDGSINGEGFPRKCLAVVISGDTVSFINDDGTVSSTYTIS